MNRDTYMFINADGGVAKLTEEEPTLEEMQAHVGGLIEYAVVTSQKKFAVPKKGKGKCLLTNVKDVIVNEEGLLLGMSPNAVATFAAWGYDITSEQQLVGPCIIVCETPSEDSEEVGLEWIVENMIPQNMRDLLVARNNYDYMSANYRGDE